MTQMVLRMGPPNMDIKEKKINQALQGKYDVAFTLNNDVVFTLNIDPANTLIEPIDEDNMPRIDPNCRLASPVEVKRRMQRFFSAMRK